MNCHRLIPFLWAYMCSVSVHAQRTHEADIVSWEFSRDSIHYERVNIPHDWAISGPFDKKWDLQCVAITQNGEDQATEKSGRSGALPWIGRGFYRTTVSIAQPTAHAELLFDGAMSEPVVYVNGLRAGHWAYGYNAFRVDITPFIKKGDNQIAVSLNNVEESSRWYPGGGLYRPVKLLTSGAERFDRWGTFIQTVTADKDKAQVRISATIAGKGKGRLVHIAIHDTRGKVVSDCLVPDTDIKADGQLSVDLQIVKPRLWSPESPALYTATVSLYDEANRNDYKKAQPIDRQTTRFGVRTISYTKEHGFCLNGVSRKFKGVCLHHDLGPLGAAVNRDALIRQVLILKDMGCDAIRTAHNMPSTMQMEVYDSLGMMVMAESFDMWIYPKCKNGYARFFKEWADKDITNLILNHRNHPSLVMYSIGNEIPEQWSKDGVRIARHLQGLCHQLDATRPVTQGLDRVDEALLSGFAEVMDIPGFNYRVHKYWKAYGQLSRGFLLGSETASTVSSRGVYKFPVTVNNNVTYPDGQVNGYDNQYCSWSNLPEVDFMMHDDYPWTIGQFVWTGFDYLGEPTPYDEYWPSRSSYFGICDLAGLPKDRYYLYRSQWNKQSHTVHLLPHWTWPGREGEITPVYCYTDGVEGELFINGKSQGRVRKDFSKHAWDLCPDSVNVQPLLDRYRLRWNHVKYEPGELRVVVYDSLGNRIGEDTRRTAGPVARLKIERQHIGNELWFYEITALDKDYNVVPNADNELAIEVNGDCDFVAACNGDATSLMPFTVPRMRLFSGKMVVILRSHGGDAPTDDFMVRDVNNPALKATLKTFPQQF